MTKYIEDLKRELNKQHLREQDINDIIQDHEEMIQNAINEGLSEEEMLKRFGNPKDLAEELASFSSKEVEPLIIPNDFRLWKKFSLTEGELSMKISLVDEDVKMVLSKNNELSVYYSGKEDISNYHCSLDNISFILEAPKAKGFLFSKPSHQNINFIIEIPANQLISSLNLSAVSSDIHLNYLKTKILVVSATSGDVLIENGQFGETKWNIVSGDITSRDNLFENLFSSQVSGDLVFNKTNVSKLLKLNTVSGDIMIDDVHCDECYLQTVSGDLNGKEFYPNSISLKSVSGDMTIKNNQHTDISVKKSSVSGEINIQH